MKNTTALNIFSREEMEVVLQNQDFRSIESMESNLQIQRNEVYINNSSTLYNYNKLMYM